MLIVLITCAAPYFTANDTMKNFRVKKSEEQQKISDDLTGINKSNNTGLYLQEFANPQASFDDIILYLLHNRIITIFILSLLLPLYQLYRYIRRRNILVSQTKNKLFMVHYLQLKDGKKNALSLSYSF